MEFEKLKSEGWTVHRNGWPDFLAEKDGVFRFIEVKRVPDRLSANQKNMCRALFRLTGIKLEVRQYKKGGDRLAAIAAKAAISEKMRIIAQKCKTENNP